MPRTPPPRPDGPPPEFIDDYLHYLHEGPPVLLDLDGHYAFVLMTLLQKLLGAQAVPSNIVPTIKLIARELQGDLSRTPRLTAYLENGWLPYADQQRPASIDAAGPAFVADYGTHIVNGAHVLLTPPGHHAWALFSVLQLACRHYPMPDGIAEQAMTLARTLQQAVSRTPTLKLWAERGWDRSYDVHD